jgi:AcrR family transcriptional regulator
MSKKTGSNSENTYKTSKKFLKAAREEFIKYGYAGASTERIVENSGMARGSLYYHYGNKQGIFREVYDQITKEFGERIITHIADEADSLKALKKSCCFFFEECKKQEIRVVMLIDGMTYIPYTKRIKILEKNMTFILRDLIVKIQKEGKLTDFNTHTIMMFVYGMIAECGRSLEYIENIDERIAAFSFGIDIALDKLAENKN